MPNYGGRAPLKTTCPQCGVYDSHPVVKTYRESYKWSSEATRVFQSISEDDIRFRQREKRCTNCGASFTSVEISKHFLSDLIDHVQRLDAEWLSLRQENHRLKKEAKRLRQIVERVNTLTS